MVIFFALFNPLLTLDRKLTEKVTIDFNVSRYCHYINGRVIIVHELIHGIFFKLLQ